MNVLDAQGKRLLSFLVNVLKHVVPGRPETYVGYKDIHSALVLDQLGPTYGESLKHQGLNSLANWTASEGKPAITGIIIDQGKLMPGPGYFRLFNKTDEDFQWWEEQVRLSKEFDWLPYLSDEALRDSPEASAITEPQG